uniref:Zinc finger and BTB domain containing 10 n=1 Tax=Sinocyclocheilus anshuiensis TaxID=1608454 RepID=A0A671QWB9_9TELE
MLKIQLCHHRHKSCIKINYNRILLLQELDKQRKSGILCDVNILVGDQVFKAHKNILVAGSHYFKTLYCLTKSENCDQTTITHLDVAAVQGFSVILDFLYSGNLLLTSQNAIEVMSVASYLQMTEVVQSCRAFIKDALNISIKQEAPDSVVVDYNKRRTVAKDCQSADKKPSNFWATSILSKLYKELLSAISCKKQLFAVSRVSRSVSSVLPHTCKARTQRDAFQTARTGVKSAENLFVRVVSLGEAPENTLNKLKCPHCNYIAKHRRTLKRHLIIHSGVRSFSCDICGKLFTRREHVKRHSLVRLKHNFFVGIRHGSRRYGVCVECADSHQGTQDLEFNRDEDFDEAGEGDEDMEAEGEEPNKIDQSNCKGDADATPEKD